MAIIKCKMCGGDLQITEGMTVAECEYCGSKQTIPTVDNEKKLTLFSRANRLRFACEFDKAAGVYEAIVADFPEEAEAYWGLVLCKYGIEYVDDPATGKKIPTCHRSSFESVMDDSNLEQALENADVAARKLYREEAKQIEELRKGIIEVSGKEELYDIFICYKETDENGDRTLDSVLAQDVYDALTDKGYRVFFSRITLEDKLGQEYEPYIFAALNSAKIMLAFGTDYEYFNAVWVKNEWSRYLQLMTQDKSKHLIPCYKGIDAYDMPKEFAKLQAQDMGKVGAIQDLLRGIAKILNGYSIGKSAPKINSSADSLIKRGYFFLEDGDFRSADEYFDRALDEDPENSKAYVGKVLARLHLTDVEEISNNFVKLYGDKIFERAIRFADGADKEQLRSIKETADRKWLVKCLTVGLKNVAKEKQIKDAENEEEQKLKQNQVIGQSIRSQKSLLRQTAKMIFSPEHSVALRIDGTVVAVGKNISGQCDVSEWKNIVAIAAGEDHTVGLRADGTVVAVGKNEFGQCDVLEWKNIVAIEAGDGHTVGLRADGTVVAVGKNISGQCDVSEWKNIVAIAAGMFHTVGLRADGTVVAAGSDDVSKWKNIVAIVAGPYHTVGLCADGTVVAVGDNDYGECDVSKWKNIVAIEAGYCHTVGLCADGTVVAVGENKFGQCDVSEWKNIVAIEAGYCHTVGLCTDGTVVDAGRSEFRELDVSELKNIIAIVAGLDYMLGLCADGTVVADGDAYRDQCKVSKWKLFDDPQKFLVQITKNAEREQAETARRKEVLLLAIEEEKREAAEAKKAEEEKRREAEEEIRRKARQRIMGEISALREQKDKLGILAFKKKKELDEQIAALEKEITEL